MSNYRLQTKTSRAHKKATMLPPPPRRVVGCWSALPLAENDDEECTFPPEVSGILPIELDLLRPTDIDEIRSAPHSTIPCRI